MLTELSSSLTVTGVIATLISVIFAGASFAIAHRRKTHHQATLHASPHPTPAAHIRTQTLRSMAPAPPQPQHAPAAELETRATSSPLFKRLGRGGAENADHAHSESESSQYLWE